MRNKPRKAKALVTDENQNEESNIEKRIAENDKYLLILKKMKRTHK